MKLLFIAISLLSAHSAVSIALHDPLNPLIKRDCCPSLVGHGGGRGGRICAGPTPSTSQTLIGQTEHFQLLAAGLEVRFICGEFLLTTRMS